MTTTSHGTSSSKQLHRANYPVHIVLEKKSAKTWISTSSALSLMNVQNMGQGHFRFIYSAKPYSILKSLKPLAISKELIEDILFSLQQTESSLINLPSLLGRLIELYGPTEKTTSTKTHYDSLGRRVLCDCLSKKPRKKSLKSGRSSRGLK